MATQILRIDGAITVEIPEELLKQAHLAVGDPVQWTLTSAGDLALQTQNGPEAILGSEDDYEEWKLKEIEAGIAEHECGQSVDGDKVAEWVRSLGTEHRLPPPQ
jgi:antitoxin component of MazEF toxin-antitoxin module